MTMGHTMIRAKYDTMIRAKYDTDINIGVYHNNYHYAFTQSSMDIFIKKHKVRSDITDITITDHAYLTHEHKTNHNSCIRDQGWVEDMVIENNTLKIIVCVLPDYFDYLQDNDLVLRPIFTVRTSRHTNETIAGLVMASIDAHTHGTKLEILGDHEL